MTSITTLLETMRMLRDKDNGCPWDIEQTFESLSPCVVEEAYEVSDAIANKDYENLKEELGGQRYFARHRGNDDREPRDN